MIFLHFVICMYAQRIVAAFGLIMMVVRTLTDSAFAKEKVFVFVFQFIRKEKHLQKSNSNRMNFQMIVIDVTSFNGNRNQWKTFRQ